MDHLPIDAPSTLIACPYRLPESFSYDGSDFSGYPKRNGWDFDKWLKNDLTRKIVDIEAWLSETGKRSDELGPFLQAWLFFGLISCSLDAKLDVQDFVQDSSTSSDTKVITTKKLGDYLSKFASRFSNATTSERDTRIKASRAAMFLAAKIFKVLQNTVEWTKYPHAQELEEVHFVATQICPLLAIIVAQVCEGDGAIPGIASEGRFGRSPLMVRRMKEGGWCIDTINRVTSTFSFDMQGYMYALGTVRTAKDHSNCKIGCCLANQAGDDFEPGHLCAAGDCGSIASPIKDVVDVLSQGFIPLLQVEFEEGKISMKVEKALPGTPYVAISHVWADGLGNSQANAIPTCQLNGLLLSLRQIQRYYVKNNKGNLTGDLMPFWLDTLCIPVDPKHKHLRDFSIQKMHHIYKESYCALVLDLDFAKMVRETQVCEVLARLLLSGWITRLWTFQEGSTPSKLFIRVRDGVIDVDRVLNGYAQRNKDDWITKRPIVDSLTLHGMAIYFATMPRQSATGALGVDYKSKGSDRFIQDGIASMSWRMTSRPGDETVCLSTSLGLDPTTILTINPPTSVGNTPDTNSQQELMFQESRMIAFLKLLPGIPLGVIFASGPRIAREGYRWAPRTFLQPHTAFVTISPERGLEPSPSTQIESPQAYLHPSDKGVVAFLPGIELPKLNLSKTRWEITCDKGFVFTAGNFFDDSGSTEDSMLENSVILVPELPKQSRHELDSLEVHGLLAGIRGKVLDPKKSRLSFKMISRAFIIGPVFVRREASGFQPSKDRVVGKLLQPKGWLLDYAID